MSRKHKGGGDGGAGGVQLGLIITPMLDMAFQILAFFIMTYHPSSLEANIPGALAPPEVVAQKGKDSPKDAPADPVPSVPEEDLDPTLNEAITVKIRAVIGESSKDKPLGSVAQIFIRSSVETDYRMVAEVDGKDFQFSKDTQRSVSALKRLDAELQKSVNKGADKKTLANLKIAPDADLKHEFVMAVYNTCKKAGFAKVSFVPPPVLNTKLK